MTEPLYMAIGFWTSTVPLLIFWGLCLISSLYVLGRAYVMEEEHEAPFRWARDGEQYWDSCERKYTIQYHGWHSGFVVAILVFGPFIALLSMPFWPITYLTVAIWGPLWCMREFVRFQKKYNAHTHGSDGSVKE